MPKSRYRRSYREKRSHSRLRVKMVLISILMVVFFILFKHYIVFSMTMGTSTMSPGLHVGTKIITTPLGVNRKNQLNFLNNKKMILQRGDIVCYQDSVFRENNNLIKFINPIVRFFTLQKITLSAYERPPWEIPLSVKRIIGLPGDTIKMENNTFYVKPAGQTYYLSEYELVENSYDTGIMGETVVWPDQNFLSSDLPETVLGESEYYLVGDVRNSSNGSLYNGPVHADQIKSKVLLKYWPISEIGIP